MKHIVDTYPESWEKNFDGGVKNSSKFRNCDDYLEWETKTREKYGRRMPEREDFKVNSNELKRQTLD